MAGFPAVSVVYDARQQRTLLRIQWHEEQVVKDEQLARARSLLEFRPGRSLGFGHL